MLNGIDAVIFDMDGTLLDSMNVWKEIDKQFLKERNIKIRDFASDEIEGMNFTQTAVYFKDRFDLPETVEQIKDIWHNMAVEKYRSEVPMKDGVAEFLASLKKNNIKCGIATSSSRNLAHICLKSLGIFDIFDTIITGEDVSEGKPSPMIYELAAEKLQVAPKHCLVFEDVPNGIRAGMRAGMKTCAVFDEFTADKTLQKKELADYYINSFTDILESI